MIKMQQSQTLKLQYERTNPEEIIFKLKTMIKILGEQNGRNELTNTFDN